MSATNKVLADGVRPAVLTAVTLYTSPANGAGTRVIAFTAANDSGSIENYTCHVVPSGGSADSTNKIIPLATVAATSGTDVPAEIQNHLIPAGGTLQVLVSTVDTICFRVTGIEFS